VNPSTSLVLSAALLAPVVARATLFVGFDDLPTPPGSAAATGLFFANQDSSTYAGITWDARTTVVGKDYRVDTQTPGPVFGLPHSGSYFITNESTDGGDGLRLTTSLVLTGAWFGRNEYYGFGAGADQITIQALHGDVVLGFVTFDLPENEPGQPEPLSFVETSSFLGLSGIDGYRILRRELGSQAGNWVADDFQFEVAAVPEPGEYALGAGAALALFAGWRRCRR
jgi:hypothetical protein